MNEQENPQNTDKFISSDQCHFFAQQMSEIFNIIGLSYEESIYLLMYVRSYINIDLINGNIKKSIDDSYSKDLLAVFFEEISMARTSLTLISNLKCSKQ